jgi:O-antigen ligase
MTPFLRRAGAALLVAATPLLFFPGLSEGTGLPQALYVRAAALGMALFAFARLGDAAVRLPRIAVPLGVFLAWSAASLLWAENRSEAMLVLARWTAAGLVFLLASQVPPGGRRALDLLIALCAGGTAVAALGIAQHLWGFSWIPQVAPPAATFANKNLGAEFIVLVLPLSIALLRLARRPALHALCAAAMALQALYLFYTFSRIAWLSVAVQGAALAVYRLRRRRAFAPWQRTQTAAFLWGVLFVVSMARFGPEGVARRDELADLWAGTLEGLEHQGWDTWMGDDPLRPRLRSRRSLSIRLAIWRNTLAMIPDAPVRGVGLGNHQVQYPAYAMAVVPDPAIGAFDIDHVHNEYLRMAAELGLVGAALFAWAGVALARLLVRRLRAADSEAGLWPTLAMALGLVGAAVGGLGGFPLDDAIPPPLLMLYVGLLAAGEPSPERRLGPAVRRLALVGLAAAFAAALYWGARQLAGDRHTFLMAKAAQRRDWTTSAEEGRRAYAAWPYRAKVLFGVGWAHLQKGEPAPAAQAFEALVAAYPYYMNALGNLGYARLVLGDLEGAERAFERVLGIKPDDARTHLFLSQLRARQGRWDEARSEALLGQRLARRGQKTRLDAAPRAP